MRESNFYQNIYSFLKLYKNKRVLKFLIPIALGVFYKLNSISLFIIPIQAIKSVSEKKFSSIIKNTFEFFRFTAPPDKYVYIFFLIIIVFSLLMLIYINRLKNFYLLKIKQEFISSNNYISHNPITAYEISDKKQISKRIDSFIQNSENIFFCLILFIFILFYDYQISLILIFGSMLYILMISINDNLKTSRNKIQTHNSFHNKFLVIFKNQYIEPKIFKPLISTIIMILIMSLLYLRTNSSISIIFIFLLRIFQRNMLNSLRKFFKRDKLPF